MADRASYYIPTRYYEMDTEIAQAGAVTVLPPPPDAVPGLSASAEKGEDVECLTDITRAFRLAGGTRNIALALARRLSTPAGGLWYDLDYGSDLRQFLHAPLTAEQLAAIPDVAEAECLKDERVQTCRVRATPSSSGDGLVLEIQGQTRDGPYALMMHVSQVTVSVLDGGQVA